jgi:hypothetical protein
MESVDQPKSPHFPVLRLLAGVIFLLAGVLAYFGILVGLSIVALFLVVAGTVVILVVVLGHRATWGDAALFVFALLVLAGVVGSGVTFQGGSASAVVYSVPKASVGRSLSEIDLIADSSAGSISLLFSGDSSLAYQVAFNRSSTFPFFSFGPGDTYSLTNKTQGAVLFLNATANIRSITLTLGPGFAASVNASTGAGSLSFIDPENSTLGVLYLHTGAGSIDVSIVGNVTRGIDLQTGAGSISLNSDYLAPGATGVPIGITTGAGSASVDVKFPSTAGASIDATTSFGGISQTLSGFTVSKSTNNEVVASSQNIATATDSFKMSVSTGAGSVSVTAESVS